MKYQSRLSRIFFPEKCSKCGEIIPIAYNFCPKCPENVTLVSDDFCEHCAHEVGRCLCYKQTNVVLPHVTAVYMYTDDIKERLHAMKFHGRLSFAKYFAHAMAKRISQVYPDLKFDAVCFVPMSKSAEKERGYNQSRILAKSLAHKIDLPVEDCLVKVRNTEKQHSLTGQGRLENIKGAFSVRTPAEVEGKVLLLCDDIKTTGATLGECAKVLLAAGAKDVYCICVALADYKS